MKANMEAMKDQMTTMMEAMMSMRKMMEVNTTAVTATSTATEVDSTHPVLDMVGQGGEALGSTGGPHFVQVQSKHPFLPYGLPPNYASPNVAHTLDKNVNNSAPIHLPNTLGSLSIAHNHNYNPYILWWEDYLLSWWKGKNSMI